MTEQNIIGYKNKKHKTEIIILYLLSDFTKQKFNFTKQKL